MLETPDSIAAILEERSLLWAPEGSLRVKEWLNSDPCLPQLRAFALHNLGMGATWEDAQDAWGEFVAKGALDHTIEKYNPTVGSFQNYLLLRLKQFCWKRAGSINPNREIAHREEQKHEEKGEWMLVDDNTPSEEVDRKEFHQGLLECLSRLGPEHSIAVKMHHLDDCSIAEIAHELKLSMSLVKIRLFRARQKLKICIEKKGFRP